MLKFVSKYFVQKVCLVLDSQLVIINSLCFDHRNLLQPFLTFLFLKFSSCMCSLVVFALGSINPQLSKTVISANSAMQQWIANTLMYDVVFHL